MNDDIAMNPYPMEGWRASKIVGWALFISGMGWYLCLEFNNIELANDSVVARVLAIFMTQGLAFCLCLEGGYLYLHRKWNIQQSVKSIGSGRIVFCFVTASIFWLLSIIWMIVWPDKAALILATS